MRVALINNGIKAPQKLLELLAGHEVQVFDSAQASEVESSAFDLMVLSGSSRFPIMGNEEALEPEFNLVLNSSIPVIGICYGCELIARAFGGTLTDLGEGSKERTMVDIEVVQEHPMFGGRKSFQAYDAHRWAISDAGPNLSILARSKHGPEVIQHCIRPIFGLQFHPEKMVDESYGDEVFRSILTQL